MIKSVKGDIWAYVKSHLIVIPVNIGWKKDSFENVMGRGLALQAAKKYPKFAAWYGLQCRIFGVTTPTLSYPDGPLIAFPTKPLNNGKPWMSWQNKSDLHLIERSTKELSALAPEQPIAVSMVGCGNGGLDMADVRPILDKHLSDDRFTLVLF